MLLIRGSAGAMGWAYICSNSFIYFNSAVQVPDVISMFNLVKSTVEGYQKGDNNDDKNEGK